MEYSLSVDEHRMSNRFGPFEYAMVSCVILIGALVGVLL